MVRDFFDVDWGNGDGAAMLLNPYIPVVLNPTLVKAGIRTTGLRG